MRTICGTFLAAVAMAAVYRVDAVTKTWSGAVNDYDWTNPGNYQDGKPSAGDTVALPDGVSVQLNDSASFTFVNTLDRITPASNATLTVSLAANVTNSLEVPFTAFPAITNSCHGRIVKTGGGTLFLNSMKMDNGLTGDKQRCLDYYCRLDINEGDVAMNQRTGGKNGMLGVVTIAADATLFTCGDPVVTISTYDVSATYFAEMWGSGSIRAMVKPSAQYKYFYLHPDYVYSLSDSVFSGTIGEDLCIYAEGRWQLTGTQSTSCASIQVGKNYGKGPEGAARLAVAKFGTANGTSSLGKGRGQINYRGGSGYVLYTGTGETTDLIIQGQTGNSNPYPSFFDAGAHGGLDIKGDISVSKYQGKMERLILTGSNTVPCSVSGQLLAGDSSSGVTGGFFFIKRGTGTWRFADAVVEVRDKFSYGWETFSVINTKLRDNRTSFTIEEGTFQFDSLAETNRYCSLGLGTRLQEPYNGTFDESHNVDYFFRLGRTNATHSIPTLELSGLGAADWGVNVGTRKVGMAGSGRISNASHNRFRLGGVSALAGGAEAVKYLYLGGTRDGGDEILDLTDGAGKLGVVKDGSGTWTLGGDVNFTGLLDVREGTLIVKRYNSRNTWFRLTATEMLQNSDYYYHYFTEAGGSASTYSLGRGYQFGPAEFGLFDASGNQVNQGVTNCWKSSEVEANGIAYDYAGFGGIDTIQYNGNKTNDYNLAKLCDGNLGSTTHSWWAGNAGGGNLSQTNSCGWVSYILRLPPGAAEVASWDVGNFYTLDANACNRIMTACILESSPDGVNWSVVTNVTRLPLPETNLALKKYWCSDFSTSLRPHTGWPVQGDSGRTWTVMPNTPVKVAPGATLRADISADEAAGKPVLSSITVSPAGNGTIDGFAFAANGTLNVETPDAESMPTHVSIAFTNAADIANIAQWSLQANSEAFDKTRKLRVTANGIEIMPLGISIIFR